jgi:hypothetical protein
MPLKLSAFLVVRDRSYRFAGESCVGRSITWCPITTMIARIRGGGKNANGASNGRMLAASTQLPPATRPATTPSPLPIHTTSAPRSAMGASSIARLSRSRPSSSVLIQNSALGPLNSCPGDSSRCLARAPAGEGYCARPVELDCHFESDLRIVHLLRHHTRVRTHPPPPTPLTRLAPPRRHHRMRSRGEGSPGRIRSGRRRRGRRRRGCGG